MATVRKTRAPLLAATDASNHKISVVETPPGDHDPLAGMDRSELERLVRNILSSGIALTFHGKRSALEIRKKVRPRVMRRDSKLSFGPPEEQAGNLVVEGENLQSMVTLYKYRGQVDLIVADPPYNTGQWFRYNDNWDNDPNDPNLGPVVAQEDGSRHTKWMKAIIPRLQLMQSMLRAQGIIAICVDENELFHLGMIMDEIFLEENRLGIINWQKTYSPKNNVKSHLSISTEYVLVYANNREQAKTALLPRSAKMNKVYGNPDDDPLGDWRTSDISGPGAATHKGQVYAVQNPFTGEYFYPPEGRCWAAKRSRVKAWLEEWGSKYKDADLEDGCVPALVLASPVDEARTRAEERLAKKPWPDFHFADDGRGSPGIKKHLKKVKQGVVAMTYWADEEYEEPLSLGAQSWAHKQSGHSQAGVQELGALVGMDHNFQTVKPLKLIKKIIQLWCPPNGLVLDPYAGSGTTGHAVFELNNETGARRRFVLIEQGSPESGDKYARTLLRKRLKRAITGERVDKKGNVSITAPPLPGGFEFRCLTHQIDARVVLSMKRDELIDVVITSHWEEDQRAGPNLLRVDDPALNYLVGKDLLGRGYFLVWDEKGQVGSLTTNTYKTVLDEARKAGVKTPYNVYARYELYQSPNVVFWKIPDKILAHLGFNESSDQFNESSETGEGN